MLVPPGKPQLEKKTNPSPIVTINPTEYILYSCTIPFTFAIAKALNLCPKTDIYHPPAPRPRRLALVTAYMRVHSPDPPTTTTAATTPERHLIMMHRQPPTLSLHRRNLFSILMFGWSIRSRPTRPLAPCCPSSASSTPCATTHLLGLVDLGFSAPLLLVAAPCA